MTWPPTRKASLLGMVNETKVLRTNIRRTFWQLVRTEHDCWNCFEKTLFCHFSVLMETQITLNIFFPNTKHTSESLQLNFIRFLFTKLLQNFLQNFLFTKLLYKCIFFLKKKILISASVRLSFQSTLRVCPFFTLHNLDKQYLF